MPDVVLPAASEVDVGRLVESLRDKTQCYKILMLRALLEALASREGTFVGYAEIATRMAEAAFWPTRLYRLRIGLDDRLSSALAEVGDVDVKASPDRLRSELMARLPDQRREGFLFYAPQRLLRPWFDAAGDPAWQAARDPDRHIRERSAALRDRLRLPFGQDEARGGVDVLPEWRRYLLDNIAIVRGWLDLQWIGWLQLRNPGVAVPLEKTAPPGVRRSIARQHRIFAAALADRDAFPKGGPCIYTGRALGPEPASLDHFVPWTYVAHDAIWNLVPVRREVNSSKGDSFPDRRFVAAIAAFHVGVIAHLHRGRRDVQGLEEYALGLRLGGVAMRDPAAVSSAYATVMEPMFAVGRSMGFPQGWSPR